MKTDTKQLLEKHFDIALETTDGIKKLRELILTLGMQGKLVPQNAKEPAAQILLKEIEAERNCEISKVQSKSLIEECKLVTSLPASEQPFPIPNTWVWVKIGVITDIERGGSPRPIDFYLTDSLDGINWIKISDTEKGGKYITSTKEKIRREGLIKTRMVYPGDFLLTNSMSFGRPYITTIEGCIHDGWLRIHPPNALEKDYLYLILSSPFVSNFFKKSASGAVVQNLNAEKVRALPIPLPPLLEQKRIVEKIDQLMALCDKLEAERNARNEMRLTIHTTAINQLLTAADKKNFDSSWQFITKNFNELYSVTENVTALKKAILQLAVMGKLVPQDPNDQPARELLKEISTEKARLIKEGKIRKQDPLPPIKPDEIPYEIPKGWQWVRLIDLVDVGTGSTPTTTNQEYYNGTIPWYTSSATNNIFANEPEKFITEKALKETNCKIFPSGSLIIALYGQGKTRGQISEIVLAGATNQAIAAMIFYNSSFQIKPYLKYFFLKIYTEIRLLAEGAAQPNLNVGKVKNTLIPLPPLAEQIRIVKKIDQLMALCDKLEKELLISINKKAEIFTSILAS